MTGLARLFLLAVFLGVGLVSFGLWYWQRSTTETPLLRPDVVSYVATSPTPTLPISVSPTAKAVASDGDFVQDLQRMAAKDKGTYAVSVFVPKTGQQYGFGQDIRMHGASIMKIPAMITVWQKAARKEIAMTDSVVMAESDRRVGTGPLQFEAAGSAYTYKQLVRYMGRSSDNTAWVMVNRNLGRTSIGDVALQSGMLHTDYVDLQTTAEDVTRLFSRLYLGQISGVDWSVFRDDLIGGAFEDRITIGVPSDTAVVYHKVGTLDDAWMDAGVVDCATKTCVFDPFVLVIMNTGVDLTQAKVTVPKLVEAVWQHQMSAAQ